MTEIVPAVLFAYRRLAPLERALASLRPWRLWVDDPSSWHLLLERCSERRGARAHGWPASCAEGVA